MNKSSAKQRRKFDKTFKREAIAHWLASGKSADVIAQELGVTSHLIYSWKQRFAPEAAGGRAASGAKPATLLETQARLEAAEREIRHLREQRDILKKTLGILSEPPLNVTNGSTR
jgi:transposase-like protein